MATIVNGRAWKCPLCGCDTLQQRDTDVTNWFDILRLSVDAEGAWQVEECKEADSNCGETALICAKCDRAFDDDELVEAIAEDEDNNNPDREETRK
jgi:hypothetical protein